MEEEGSAAEVSIWWGGRFEGQRGRSDRSIKWNPPQLTQGHNETFLRVGELNWGETPLHFAWGTSHGTIKVFPLSFCLITSLD